MGWLLTSFETIAAPLELRFAMPSVSGVANTGFHQKREVSRNKTGRRN